MARPKGAKTVNRTPGVKPGPKPSGKPKPEKAVKGKRPLLSPSEERGHTPRLTVGHVMNPDGRPKKGESLSEMLRERMSEYTPDGRRQYKSAVVDRVMSVIFPATPKSDDGKVDERLNLDMRRLSMDAIKWAFERVDGKAIQPIDAVVTPNVPMRGNIGWE